MTPAPVETRVLVADADRLAGNALADAVVRLGHAATTVHDSRGVLDALSSTPDEDAFDIVMLDVSMGGAMDLLRDLTRKFRGTAVIVTSGYATVEGAVESLRLGACDYLVKPLVDQELRESLDRALRQRALLAENLHLRRRVDAGGPLDNVTGTDPRMLKVYDLVSAVAASKTTVLMEGESGTGKSLIARAIHERSPRREKPFVELSCGSIPETLLESELFGHVKGAFTGAHADKVGRFLAADQGTIFLDEINSASPAMQLKLLRVLQERRFESVGSSKTQEVDVRVILASNQPLDALVATGAFRQDLYYRINVVKIELPALRDRAADIPALAASFLERQGRELGKQFAGFSDEAMEALQRYRFPGNVRELQNIVERAAVLARNPTIHLGDLPEDLLNAPPPVEAGDEYVPMTLEEALREPERRLIEQALRAHDFSRQKTADALGINRTTLYKKMKALGLLGNDAA
ncbi:MAG: sigma-54-dependent Fis family transcriptional regulator [Phycisphaerales bacterium]|nr:sigma-54-dependent Fis family transcriptional regulator [Phycisphaerales bacterium]